jgi:oligoendopeptidase F
MDDPETSNRDKIPENYKWDLSDLYQTREEWEKEKETFSERFAKIETYKGRLGSSAETLYEALTYLEEVVKELYKFSSYASMLSDQDTRKSEPLAMDQEASQISTKFSTAASYITPEILSIPENKLKNFMNEEPRLSKFEQYIDNIYRTKEHTLSTAEENIIAQASLMQGNSYNIYSIFSNAEMPRAEIALSNGEKVNLDAAGYARYRASNNRDDRIKVFESFFGELNKFRMTLGTQLYGKIKENMFSRNVRKYNSCLEASLDQNNIPTEVYHKLIENANKNLPTLHRYLNLRKKMLGVDELHYYDIYAPLVGNVDLEYNYDEATDVILESLSVLGDDYKKTLKEAFDNRWIDVYPNTGKRSGAYSNGSAYDIHPYILLNYNGKYDDVSTLAHELGHTMHSYFSNKNQPFINANYPIFLAEVASTANEALLMDYTLKQIEDPQIKLSILGNYLENARATLFRQTQFAEFELRIHELAEKGESLTGEKFSEIYLEILKKYYGHDQGVMTIDDLYAIEWAYIPHFYYNFYVFQYSTSFTASTMLAENMLNGGEEMINQYIDFLSSGSSDYAIPTLKKVGIDMTSDEPFVVTMAKMNQVMDEIEKILAQSEK